MITTKDSIVAAETIAVIGAKGQLGTELLQPQATCAPQPDLIVHGLDVGEIDITKPDSMLTALERIHPRAVINAAAYTDVDACETHAQEAHAINADGPGNLAQACKQLGCRLLHVSTDYVFDGRATAPYKPDHPVNPQSVYGKTKAEGEQRVREILADHLIVRTSWLFGVHGKNFVKAILNLASERPELRVVTDQVGRPTFARDLAAALLSLSLTDLTGTYHFANEGVCSWNQLATEIIRLAGLTTPVRPMATAELNRPAQRPAYSVLDTTTLTDHTGIRPRPWQDALAECMAEMLQARCQS